jgi:hypothetical protein
VSAELYLQLLLSVNKALPAISSECQQSFAGSYFSVSTKTYRQLLLSVNEALPAISSECQQSFTGSSQAAILPAVIIY